MMEATISALCYSLCHERSGDDRLAPPFNDVVRFVDSELKIMTDFVRPPILLLTFLFMLSSLLSSGHLFHNASLEARQKQIARWRNSQLRFLQEFIQFYESLICMPLYHRLAIHIEGDA